ncbi:hypothetical protein H4S08_001711 [Coemansia sp. RSA 1365]|nr:hypothetical protein H4S08_001711 [Coemansia sp. RSA 1365]
MERPQYNCCMRQTTTTGILQQEVTTTHVQDGLRDSEDSSGNHSAQYIINSERKDSSSDKGDKSTARHDNAVHFSRSNSTAPPSMYPRQSGPAVQTNNRLTEDYSRKVHCYISQMESDDVTPGDHMPPPVLPSFEPPDTVQEIPFWRPPPVLQREPHYNHPGSLPASDTVLYASQSLHSQQCQKHQVPVGSAAHLRHCTPKSPRARKNYIAETAAQRYSQSIAAGSYNTTPTSSLSPALLAISNSHYKQQQRQEQGHGLRSSMPTIQSLLASPPSPQPCIAAALPVDYQDSIYLPGLPGQPNEPVFDANNNHASLTADDGGCKEAIATADLEKHVLKLPPIAAYDTGGHGSHDVHSGVPLAPCGVPNTNGEQETVSFAGLVGVQERHVTPPHLQSIGTPNVLPVSDYVSRITHTVSLPGIASLARPALYKSEAAYRAIELPPRVGAGPDDAVSLPLSPQRKRQHGGSSTAEAFHKMARTGDKLLSIGKPRPTEQTTPAFLRALQDHPLCRSNQVVITCYHASVAQKSYGGEKRFLCPPPAVLMYGEGSSAQIAHHSPMLLSVVTDTGALEKADVPRLSKQDSTADRKGSRDDSLIYIPPATGSAGSGHLCNGTRSSSSAHAPLECQTSFNERNVALFKSLHVTGMQKAKSFRLHLDLLAPSGASRQLCNHNQKPWQAPGAYASLESDPVAIISKPSKKTAKARNQSSCIREGSLISLFNRINSQTFRTKYLNVDHRTNRWVAQSHNWSPLEVVVVSTRGNTASPCHAGPANQTETPGSGPLYYGSEIVLVESRRNFQSPPMIIHKVERGRLIENASSPVSQMQKIALQLKPEVAGDIPRYLKADVGHYSPISTDASAPTHFDDPDDSPELAFETLDSSQPPIRARSRELQSECGAVELDDAFCWTIVGISRFTYAYSIPDRQASRAIRYINPIPRVTSALLKTTSALSLCMPNFDESCMQLLLNGLPLKVEPCKTISALPEQQRRANRAGVQYYFIAQLSAGADTGDLSIRRTDGVLHHTKWTIHRRTPSSPLEVFACNLDI